MLSLTRSSLSALAARVAERLSSVHEGGPTAREVGVLGGLSAPGIHELLFERGTDGGPGVCVGSPACAIHIAASVIGSRWCPGGVFSWIGRRCWPYPIALARASHQLLLRSIFIDPPNRDERVWAVDLALRSEGSAMVIADGSRLTLNETRRLQLASEAGRTLGVLLRDGGEKGELSAARTRWLVTPAFSADADQRWTVELLRRKGVRPTSGARRWAVTRSHATGDVRVVPDAADRSLETSTASLRRAM